MMFTNSAILPSNPLNRHLNTYKMLKYYIDLVSYFDKKEKENSLILIINLNLQI